MTLRGEIELTLPNRSLIRLTKTVLGAQEDLIQIVQVGLNGTTDTVEVIGSIAHHLDMMPISHGPVTRVIKIHAGTTEGAVIVKYLPVNGTWMIIAVARSNFLHSDSVQLWQHLQNVATPFPTPEPVECD